MCLMVCPPPHPIKNRGYAYAAGAHIFRIFPIQYHNSLAFAARQIANNSVTSS